MPPQVGAENRPRATEGRRPRYGRRPSCRSARELEQARLRSLLDVVIAPAALNAVVVARELEQARLRSLLDVVVKLELVGVRAQPDRVDLVDALVAHPGLDEVLG